MRADMHEVLIERPRGGGRLKTHRGNKPRVGEWDGEDGFVREYRPRRLRTKYLSDLLSPLKRWLRAQADRPWDKVWSELCAGIDTGSVIGRHLLDHARDLVQTDCRYDAEGRLWREGFDYALRQFAWVRADGLFVDPRTGILRWRQPPARYRHTGPSPDPDVIPLQDDDFRLKLHGIWYFVTARALPWDPKQKEPGDFVAFDQRWSIVRKTQLNRKELRAAGLTND